MSEGPSKSRKLSEKDKASKHSPSEQEEDAPNPENEDMTSETPEEEEEESFEKVEDETSNTNEVGEDGGEVGAEDDDDDEDTFREPIMDGRNITFQTRLLNQYLVCSLCMGYFREPYTIKECLHTFCKVCISRFLLENNFCPTCEVSLSPHPFDYVRYDRTLATLIATIFPQMMEQELEDERKFCEAKGLPIPQHVKEGLDRKGVQPPKQMVVRKLTPEEAKKAFYSDEIAFQLHLDPSANKDPSLPQITDLQKPHIRTTSKITISYIKKYLGQKLGVTQIDLMDVLYKGEVLGMEHSLDYVLRLRGRDQKGDIILTYRLRQLDHPL